MRASRIRRIFVGGIPRGGTSLTLDLLGAQTGVFGWPGETSCLSLVRAIWAGGAPNAACRDQVETFVRSQLSIALIEMQTWNIDRAGDIGAPLPSALQVESLTVDVVEACFAAASLRSALLGAVRALDRFLAQFSDAAVMLEKTPDNIFAYSHLGDQEGTLWVVTHREPFAVISSVRRRAGQDPFSSDWETSLDGCIGLYLRYARRVIAAQRASQGAIVASFDDTCDNPDRLAAAVAQRLGLGDPVSFPIAGAPFARSAWQTFSPEEQWKVLSLTEMPRRALGYGDAYYGVDESAIAADVEWPKQLVVSPMHGVYQEAGSVSSWVSGEALYSVFAPPGVDAIEVELFNPDILGVVRQDVAVRDVRGCLVAAVQAPRGRLCKLRIELDAAAPVRVTPAGRLYLLSLYASFCTLPLSRVPGQEDARLLALVASPWRAGRGNARVGNVESSPLAA